jgi:hypothetical protein
MQAYIFRADIRDWERSEEENRTGRLRKRRDRKKKKPVIRVSEDIHGSLKILLPWSRHPARSSAWPVSRIQKPILYSTLPAAIPCLLQPALKICSFVSSFADLNAAVVFLSFRGKTDDWLHTKRETQRQRGNKNKLWRIAERFLKSLHFYEKPLPFLPEMQFADRATNGTGERGRASCHWCSRGFALGWCSEQFRALFCVG